MSKELYRGLLDQKQKIKNKTLSSDEAYRVYNKGQSAAMLLTSDDFIEMFLERKFQIMDELTNISGYLEEDNQRRIKLSIELNALKNFKAVMDTAIKNGKELVSNMPQ